MRRPTFERWVKRECCRIAHAETFSLPKLAALAQSPRKGPSDKVSRKRLAAALHLYAMSNGVTGRLHAHVYQETLKQKLSQVESHIGARDIQRLALRGTPMLSLPIEYREILKAFQDAYHAPELTAARKKDLQAQSRSLQLQLGLTPTEIAKAVGATPTNVTAYLTSAATEKLSLKTAQSIQTYLHQLAEKTFGDANASETDTA